MVGYFTIRDSLIRDNVGNGVWCDIGCGGPNSGTFLVEDNVIRNNTRQGIHYELANSYAVIRNNLVQTNNTDDEGYRGGISITSSRNAEVYGNTLGGNKRYGIDVRNDRRVNCGDPTRNCGYPVDNILIRDNILNGDALTGCDVVGVTCSRNGS